VEGDHQLGEPVVFVELVDHVVDHVLLDFHFSEFIHGLQEHDGSQVALLVEVAGVLLGLDFLEDVAVGILQFVVLLVKLLDFLVGVVHDLVLYLEVAHGVLDIRELLQLGQSAESFAERASVQPLEHHPEAVARELLGRVPLGRFPPHALTLVCERAEVGFA